MSLNLICGDKSIVLNKQQCLSVELDLNKSDHGKKWIHLGDILYSWASETNYKNLQEKNIYEISNEQLIWVKDNLSKN